MKRPAALLIVVAALFAVPPLAALTIKMGTLAPTGTPWEEGLNQINAEWNRISNGAVKLKVFWNGNLGDEPAMLRDLSTGALDAAAITVSGLNLVFSGVKALSYPLFIRTDEELAYVLGKMRPFFEREIAKRGYTVVMWSPAGWVYFYSRHPIVTPDDLKRQKLWVWEGDPDEVQAWQSAGFRVEARPEPEILVNLTNGAIDALVASPLIAAQKQWFAIANNQTGMRLAPMFGAAVVRNEVWEAVPRDLQPKLIAAAAKVADTLGPKLAKADADAIAQMTKLSGLKVNPVPLAAEEEWRKFVAKGFELLIGKTFDRESLKMAQGYLAEYRASHGSR